MDQSFIAQCINTAHAANARREFDVAIWWSRKVIEVTPGLPEGWFNLGVALGGQGKRGEAIEALEKANALTIGAADAQNSIGLQFIELDAHEQAEQCLQRSISIAPAFVFPHINLGKLRANQKRFDEAAQHFRRAIEFQPDIAPAFVNLGGVLNEQKKFAEAEAVLRKAIALDPNSSDAWNNLGQLLTGLRRHDEAEVATRNAIAFNPTSSKAWNNLATALFGLKRYQEAAECFGRCLELNPGAEYLEGAAMLMRMLACEWHTRADDLKSLLDHVQAGHKATVPFPLLALTTNLKVQRKAAEVYVADQFPPSLALGPVRPASRADDKIRVGYFSADFREHPVSHLLVETIELHDRSRYEVFGFSFGPETQDKVRQRVAAAFDQFIECRDQSDVEVAALSRQLGIDIAVDLGGHTEDARTGVFALRAAPVQVSYLGYLGTMGASYIDYLIADAVIIPDERRSDYGESIVYLPSYQANDSKRIISNRAYSREDLGLPPTGFVFCCFNNCYKISPQTFDVWMRLLQGVAGSVLLLYADNPLAAENLKREAQERGIDAARLVFVGLIERSDYLARFMVADLFLDTFPYNAGTTASDALWAGLPVLTCMGESFASRIAASLLRAIDLPELITSSPSEYERLAIELAADPDRLLQIRHKLSQNRLTTLLFDSRTFTFNLERAYRGMHERSMAGLPPCHMAVPTTPLVHR